VRLTPTAEPPTPPLSDREHEKQAAARAAAELVPHGARIGLGTGSTVAHLLPALAARDLDLRCAATSPATEIAARALGLQVSSLDELGELDIAIDGADQIDPAGWLVKGGGGAHTREKIIAAAARRFVVIADSSKRVDTLRAPIPIEIIRFGAAHTLTLADARLRDVPPTPENNLIADYHGPIGDPTALAAWLVAIPGVVEHGLFPPAMTTDIIVATGDRVEHQPLHRPD
jgi:ribose 5-phosphate isomerase A